MPPGCWERFADLLLQREAALCRIVAGVPPRDLAGLFVDSADLEALLRTLPGLDGPAPAAVEPVRRAFAEPLAAARRELHRWLADDPGELAGILRRARLRPDEAEVLSVLLAVELHPARQRLVCYVQDSVQLPRLTLATLGRLFGPGHPGELAVAPQSAARRSELVSVDVDRPWAVRMCSAAARLVWAVRGDCSPDPDLPPGACRMSAAGPRAAGAGPAEPVAVHPEPAAGQPELAAAHREPAPGVLVLVHGADRQSRLQAVQRLLCGTDVLLLPGPAAAAPSGPDAHGPDRIAVPSWSAAQWAAVVREATVAGLAVLIELAGPPDLAMCDRLSRAAHLRWAFSSRTELPLESLPDLPVVERGLADGAAEAADWLDRLGCPAPAELRLNREQLRLVTIAAGRDPQRLPAAVRRLAGGHLDRLAVRVRPRRGWTDLVLPGDQLAQLRELAMRHRLRGTVFGSWGFPELPSTGVVALFAGPSGTGKTLAAEVIAADLGLDLYKVDLSAVVSKYIGETEQNLERIFDSASAGDLVLFFDEADALFGKRSEVSDAHDRYANIEVAYLLQRLETYPGLVVLATNLQRNIDEAFLRRITVAVDFAAPDEQHRRAIWQGAFPPGAPVGELDLDFLAGRFKVTGGVIRNVALGAAFRAAAAGGPIGMEHVLLAMRREYGKLGRLRTEDEFGPYLELVSRGES